jgi:hypothetical protein
MEEIHPRGSGEHSGDGIGAVLGALSATGFWGLETASAVFGWTARGGKLMISKRA